MGGGVQLPVGVRAPELGGAEPVARGAWGVRSRFADRPWSPKGKQLPVFELDYWVGSLDFKFMVEVMVLSTKS